MDSKFYFLAVVCLIGGLVGGYLIASTTLQNQTLTYELRLQSKDAELSSLNTQLEAKDITIHTLTTMIDSQDALIQELKANVTKLQEQLDLLANQSSQAQTQVRIDTVTWLKTGGAPNANFDLLIRNTGSVAAQIESISIRTNTAGSTASVWTAPAGSSINVGATGTLHFLGWYASPRFTTWVVSMSYVIRVTTSTGFYYEMVATTPSF